MKKGTAYEQLVALVMSAFHPDAVVKQGEWVEGPDGRRDMDVLVEGKTGDGTNVKMLVECKDYDVSKTGPVGINIIDALDSKGRDLSIDTCIVCSNSGFTDDALRKAKRLGIGAITVLRKDDDRVKLAIVDKRFFQVCKILDSEYRFQLYKPKTATREFFDPSDVRFGKRQVIKWVEQRLVIQFLPDGDEITKIEKTFRFKTPLRVRSGGHRFHLESITGRLSLEKIWYSETIRIDAGTGFKDWITGQIALSSGANSITLHDVGIAAGKGELEKHPPEERDLRMAYGNGSVGLGLMLVDGIHFKSDEEIPSLDKYVIKEGLALSPLASSAKLDLAR